jgi:hypothetical protein
MEYNQFYTTIEFNFYITPTEDSFWQNNVRRRKFPRQKPHSKPRINICKVSYSFDDPFHLFSFVRSLYAIVSHTDTCTHESGQGYSSERRSDSNQVVHSVLKTSHPFRPRNDQVRSRLDYGQAMEGALDRERSCVQGT